MSTEEEARCVCGHREGDHRVNGACLVCGCNVPTFVDLRALKRGNTRVHPANVKP